MGAILENPRGVLPSPGRGPANGHRKMHLKVAILVVFACFAMKASHSFAAQTQTLAMGVKPGKLDLKRRSNSSIRILAETSDPDSAVGIPSPTTRASFSFDDDFVFNPRMRGLHPCEAAWINALTTNLAKQRCPNSVLGDGEATARIPWPVPTPACDGKACLEVDAGITVFHSTPEPVTGRARLLLFVRQENTLLGTTILGTLRPASSGKDFGMRLDVVVPPIAADSALTTLDVTIGGPQRPGYVMARCGDRNKRLNMVGDLTFLSGQKLSASASSRCFPV